MAGTVLKVTVHDAPFQRFVGDLQQLDTRPLFDEIGAYVVARTNERFEQGVSPDGKAWTPSQRAESEGGKTLIDHGHLRDSYTHVVMLAGDAVEIGSNMVYAAIHHFGGKAGRRNRRVTIEARPALGIDDVDNQEIEFIVHDFLRDATNKAMH